MRYLMRQQFTGLFLAACLVSGTLLPGVAHAWGNGHGLIRVWAVKQLPAWQTELIGEPNLQRLCQDYTSLQDTHAGGNASHLDPYCIVPGVDLSLHDLAPPDASAQTLFWYMDQINQRLSSGQNDEAMKFLGVLCHWNEDPGCPSAHCTSINEFQLRKLLPPPRDKQSFNYLFGAGGIMDVGDYRIPDEKYQPRLLGRTREAAALRIHQHQRLLDRNAAQHIVPIVQDMMYGDGKLADEHRAMAALYNAKHTTDIIYTVICLAAGRFDAGQPEWQRQRLTEWLPEFRGTMIPHPYYVTPFLVDQAMDATRKLHPLAFSGTGASSHVRFGYGMGAPFSLDFGLAPGGVFRRFTCRVGLHPTAGPQGSVVFVVTANGAELARTEPLSSGDAPVEINVELPEVEVLNLSLQTIPAAGSNSEHNLTVWAEPTLHRN